MNIETTVLVAAAVGAAAYTGIRLAQRFGQEKAENLAREDRGPNTVYHFISKGGLLQLRIAFALVAAGALATILLLALPAKKDFLVAPIAGGAGLIGWMLPLLWFKRRVKARAELFADQMLDLSMGVSNGLKAGQALAQAIEVYSRNCQDPMREELATVLREHRLGIELPEALERMYGRIPCEDLKLFSVSVGLTLKSGGSLADVMAKITMLIRNRMDFRRRLSALTAQGRFEALAMSLAPVAAFILLFLAERDLMIPLVTTCVGWLAICVVVALELTGYAIIRKIVDIEV